MGNSISDLILAFLSGAFLSGLGVGYFFTKRRYMTRHEVLELLAEVEECTLEQVLETIELIENQNAKIIKKRNPNSYH